MERRNFIKTSIASAVLLTAPQLKGLSNVDPTESKSVVNKKSSKLPLKDGVIVISDMSVCKPAKNLSRTFEKNKWQLVEYETVEGIKGFMASAYPDQTCGELTLPLNAKGVYKIYLGIYESKSHYKGDSKYGRFEVKLTDDQGYRRVGPEWQTVDEDGSDKFGGHEVKIYKAITDAYWKTADLTGQSLTFRQLNYPYNRREHGTIANLTYVKLEPLSEKEKLKWQQFRQTDETHRLALIFCTGQFTGHTRGTYTFRPTSKDWFKDEFEPYRHTDIKIFIFEALRGNSCVYKTSIGSHGTEDNQWKKEWVDPLEEFTKLAHENDMKIFASMRFIGPQYPMNRSPIAWASYYWKNPQWTMLNKEGIPITNLSLAYPEVRQYWLSLLRETLSYGIDGIQLHLNRSEPYVFYEEPVVKSFINKFGFDPRTLSREDPRWVEHSAEYLTQFIREVRMLVDEIPGRELGITISGRKNGRPVHYTENHCDVETWITEQLVDYIMPTPYLHESHLKKWRKLGGSRVHIWPDLMPRAQTAASYARNAKKYYEAGADGLCLWDGERRTHRITEWSAVQRLGHKNQLDQIVKEGPSYYGAVDLKTLGGFDVKWSFKDG